MQETTDETFDVAYFIFQAGGNMGGDVDQVGRPILEGGWYVACQRKPLDEDPGDAAGCVAGPFPTRGAAKAVARDCNTLTIPAARIRLSQVAGRAFPGS